MLNLRHPCLRDPHLSGKILLAHLPHLTEAGELNGVSHGILHFIDTRSTFWLSIDLSSKLVERCSFHSSNSTAATTASR